GLYQPGYYIHDCHVRGDTLYAAAFNNGKLDFVSTSNPEELVVFNVLNDPGANTHSCSTTEDHNTLFLADELDGLPGRIFDLTSEEDLDQLATYSANLESLVHNPYIVGNDLAYISHNTEGLRILDIADPRLPVEVGYYDTFDGESGGFFGLWSACPYLPSGRILGGDRWRGLMLFEYNGIQAGRVYVQVVDSISGEILPETQFYFAGDTIELDAEARWSYGTLPTTLSLDFELNQYEPKTIEISLESQDQINLVVEMVPEGAGVHGVLQSALVVYPNPAMEQIRIEEGPGKGQILIFSALGQEVITQAANGSSVEISIKALPAGTYCGKWLGNDGTSRYFNFIRK
ncbi:MAG: T9SS type A sorting domain-containing protein, partial [Bacteroidota bacterium]